MICKFLIRELHNNLLLRRMKNLISNFRLFLQHSRYIKILICFVQNILEFYVSFLVFEKCVCTSERRNCSPIFNEEFRVKVVTQKSLSLSFAQKSVYLPNINYYILYDKYTRFLASFHFIFTLHHVSF